MAAARAATHVGDDGGQGVERGVAQGAVVGGNVGAHRRRACRGERPQVEGIVEWDGACQFNRAAAGRGVGEVLVQEVGVLLGPGGGGGGKL